MDYQNVPSLEFRFYGDDIDSLHAVADRLMERMREMPGLQWVHSDYEDPRAVAEVTLDPVTSSQLGVTRTLAAANLALASGNVAVGSVWEGDYKVPVVLKNEESRGERSLSDVNDTYVSSLVPGVNGAVAANSDGRAALERGKDRTSQRHALYLRPGRSETGRECHADDLSDPAGHRE